MSEEHRPAQRGAISPMATEEVPMEPNVNAFEHDLEEFVNKVASPKSSPKEKDLTPSPKGEGVQIIEGPKMAAYMHENEPSEALFKVGFCLPAGPYVSDDDVRYIVDSIKEAIVG